MAYLVSAKTYLKCNRNLNSSPLTIGKVLNIFELPKKTQPRSSPSYGCYALANKNGRPLAKSGQKFSNLENRSHRPALQISFDRAIKKVLRQKANYDVLGCSNLKIQK